MSASAATNCRRRVATMETLLASATMADGVPSRTASSITARRAASSRGWAWITAAAGSPICSSAGAYRSARQLAHNTGPPVAAASRAAMLARKSVVAASSTIVALCAVASCSAPARRPPAPSRPSIALTPKGMMRKSVAGVAIVRRCAMVGADESRAAGIRVRLYSFPLCSVTEPRWSSPSRSVQRIVPGHAGGSGDRRLSVRSFAAGFGTAAIIGVAASLWVLKTAEDRPVRYAPKTFYDDKDDRASDTGFISAEGTLVGPDMDGRTFLHIECRRGQGSCRIADLSNLGAARSVFLHTDEYPIKSWNAETVVAESDPPSYGCNRVRLTIQRQAQSVEYLRIPVPQADKSRCQAFDRKPYQWTLGNQPT